MYRKSNMETCITICKIDSQGNFLYGTGNSNRCSISTWGGGCEEIDGRGFLEGGDI